MTFVKISYCYPSKETILSTLKNTPKIKENFYIEEKVLEIVSIFFADQTFDVQMVIPLVKEALERSAFPKNNEEILKATVQLLTIAMLNLGKYSE